MKHCMWAKPCENGEARELRKLIAAAMNFAIFDQPVEFFH